MWQIVTNFFVGLFRAWYGEWSRDKAHEDKGRAEANLEHEKRNKKKIEAADDVTVDVSPDGLRNDKNASDY
jgi:hypothetical protein